MAQLLVDNGGRVVSHLLEPSLTHIIMDDDDSARYVPIMRKTAL